MKLDILQVILDKIHQKLQSLLTLDVQWKFFRANKEDIINCD